MRSENAIEKNKELLKIEKVSIAPIVYRGEIYITKIGKQVDNLLPYCFSYIFRTDSIP